MVSLSCSNACLLKAIVDPCLMMTTLCRHLFALVKFSSYFLNNQDLIVELCGKNVVSVGECWMERTVMHHCRPNRRRKRFSLKFYECKGEKIIYRTKRKRTGLKLQFGAVVVTPARKRH